MEKDNFKVYKMTKACDGCGKPLVYFRLPFKKGRGPSYHNSACARLAQFNKNPTVQVIDVYDAPPAWRDRLILEAERHGVKRYYEIDPKDIPYPSTLPAVNYEAPENG